MWHTTILVATIALCSGAVLGDDARVEARLEHVIRTRVGDARVEARLEHELWEMEHEGRHHHHHHHHEGHRQNRNLGLLGRHRADPAPSGLDTEPVLGRRPDVAIKLAHMDGEIRTLKSHQQSAVLARSNLEGQVKEAAKHTNRVAGIRGQLARTQVQIRSQERKLQILERDRERLDLTHLNLRSSLHHIMEPKIKYAEMQLQKKMEKLNKLASNDAQWKDKVDKFHTAALATLEERRKSKQDLELARVAEEKAHQDREVAEKRLVESKQAASFNIGGYKYSLEEERAAMSKEERGKEQAIQEEISVKRLSHIMDIQERRVDESMALGKDRLLHKIQHLEKSKQRSSERLAKLKQTYLEWKDQNRANAAELARAKQNMRAAAQNFADNQGEVLAAAGAKVVSDAEHRSDWAWDDWPGRDGADDIP